MYKGIAGTLAVSLLGLSLAQAQSPYCQSSPAVPAPAPVPVSPPEETTAPANDAPVAAVEGEAVSRGHSA